MRGVDELALVVELACETSDRSTDEQKALLSVALKVDCDRAKWLTSNSEPVRPYLFDRAEDTYEPDSGRRLRTPKGQRTKLDRQIERYEEGLAARDVLRPVVVEDVPGPDTLSLTTGDGTAIDVRDVEPGTMDTSAFDEVVDG